MTCAKHSFCSTPQPKANESKAAFLIRQRHANDPDNLASRGTYQEDQYVNEPEEMAVGNRKDSYRDSDDLRNNDPKRERLIDRIKNLKEDLNEIERDLRNNRDL